MKTCSYGNPGHVECVLVFSDLGLKASASGQLLTVPLLCRVNRVICTLSKDFLIDVLIRPIRCPKYLPNQGVFLGMNFHTMLS